MQRPSRGFHFVALASLIVLGSGVGCSGGGGSGEPSARTFGAALAPAATPSLTTGIATTTTPPTVPTNTIIPDAAGVLPPIGDGALSVGDRGDAHQHIPIWVPPGRAGMQPQLSLEYSSTAPDGLVGVGWTFAGLSRITRCKALRQNFKIAPPIQWNWADSYCLDGEPLVTDSDKFTYRKFHDDGSLIVRWVAGQNPDNNPLDYWEMRTKSGRIYKFGSTADSRTTVTRYLPPGGAVMTYALSRVQDFPGNFMTVTYQNATGGDIIPLRIDYTGSASDPGTYRSVSFFYDTARPDVDQRAFAGQYFTYVERLVRLEMNAPNIARVSPLRSFSLGYTVSPSTGRSLLSTIAECDGPAPSSIPVTGSTPLCRQESFTYAQGVPVGASGAFEVDDTDTTGAQITDVSPLGAEGVGPNIHMLDVDGDGRDDVLYLPTDADEHYTLRFSAGRAFGPPVKTDIPVSIPTPNPSPGMVDSAPIVLDFNGDGHADVLVNQGTPDAPAAHLYLANNAQNQGPWTLGGPEFEAPLWTGYSHYQSADLDGDGLPDLIMFAGGNAYYSLNRGGNFAYLTQPALITLPASADYYENFSNYFLDFNGDGVTDIMTRIWADQSCFGTKVGVECFCSQMRYGGLDLYPYLYTSGAPSPTTSRVVGGLTVCTGAVDEITQYTPYFGDFNGDGMADVIQTYVPYDPNGNPQPMHFELALGDGNGDFTPQGTAGDFALPDGAMAFQTMDADLDGKTDFVIRTGPTTPYTVYSWKSQAWHPTTILIGESPLLYAASQSLFASGDVNGDGAPDMVAYTAIDSNGNGKLAAYERITSGPRPDLLTGTKGDFGPTATVKYAPYLVGSTEDRSDCQAPVACVTRAGSLVSEIDVDNGINGTNVQEHSYASGRADMLGWGLLGFKTHTIKDDATGMVTTRTFDLSANTTSLATPFFPFVGMPVEVDSTVGYRSGAQPVTRTSTSSTTYTVQASTWGVFMALPTASSSKTIDSNSIQPLALESIQRAFDAYGSVTSETDTFPTDFETRVTTTTYLNDTTNWIIGRPTYVSVTDTQSATTSASATREKAYTYDANGLLAVEIDNPGAPNGSSYDPLPAQQDGVQTLYTQTMRDPNGMPTVVQMVDNLTTPTVRRATAFHYDTTEGMYVVLTIDGAGLATGSAYEPGLGVLAAKTDAAGVLTTYQYDTFGRIRADHPAAGGDRSVTYHAATSGNFGSTEDHRLGQYDVTSTLDSLHRAVATKTTGRADGKAVLTETTYDKFGQVVAKTRPHFAGATDGQTVTNYDNVGRVTQTTAPDGSSQTTTYLGRVVTTTNPDGNMTQVQNDSQGHPLTSVQAKTSGPAGLSGPVTTTTLTYGPFFELAQSTDTEGNAILRTYDRLGRPLIKQDGDTGATGYLYDVFGEIIDELRGATLVRILWGGHVTITLDGGEHTTLGYDGDGRVTSKAAPDVQQVFTWDTVYPGKLSNATVSGGTTIAYTYDGFGNLQTKTWGGPRGPIGYAYTYDKYDRLSTTTYPALPAATNQPALVVKNTYSGGDLGGQLTGVSDVTNPTSPKAYWMLKSTDATETFPVSTLRNGVQTTLAEDPSHPGWLERITSKVGTNTVQSLAYSREGAGRINGRQDTVNGTTETFGYDGLERLTSWTWQGAAGARAVQYVYDDIGNLSQRNVVAGPGTSVTYTYGGGNGIGPHQVAGDGSGTAFAYDAQGNQLVAPGRSFAFNSFDRPTSVTASAGTYTMTYDADLARFSRTDPSGGVRYSYGRLFEEFNDTAGTHYVMTIAAAGKPVAEVEKLVSGTTLKSTTVNTVLVDALGSLDALVGSNGKPLTEKYDPFGARVTASDPTVHVTAPPRDLRIGFTGHEQDDDVDLVDMIGRVYDPVQQRFLSADPPAPDPVDGQAYNPYAYVRNNPLNATDPTGYLTINGSSLGLSPNAGLMCDMADSYLGWLTLTVYTIPYGEYPGEDAQGTSGDQGPGADTGDTSKIGVVDASGAAKGGSNGVEFAKFEFSDKNAEDASKKANQASDGGRLGFGLIDYLLEPVELERDMAKVAAIEAAIGKDASGAAKLLETAEGYEALARGKSILGAAGAVLTFAATAVEYRMHGGSWGGTIARASLFTGFDFGEGVILTAALGPVGLAIFIVDGLQSAAQGEKGHTMSGRVAETIWELSTQTIPTMTPDSMGAPAPGTPLPDPVDMGMPAN